MNRQNSYAYASYAPQPAASRYTPSQSTSSAQSASANPDEDWTKISDLAERRRIQNRIAQRNYRKKLKRRLEDLERRAGSSSPSPEQSHVEIVPVSQPRPRDDDARKRKTKTEIPASRRGRSPNPPTSMHDNPSGMFSRQYTRQLSASPPPDFGYASYSMAEPPQIHAPYPQHAPYHSLPAPYSDYSSQSLSLPPLPVTLPSMSSYGAPAKGEYMEDEMISHFNMSYPSMGGMEIPTSQSYSDQNNPYTPPLSLSHSFDHSRTGSPSDASIIYPGTPLSIPTSPHYLMG